MKDAMRWLMLLVLLCASTARAANCPQPSGYCFAIQFIGFPEYSEEQHLYIAGVPGQQLSAEREVVHPELQGAFFFGSWQPGSSYTNSFMYADPYSNTGGLLFPMGSKYEKFQLTWDLICADIKGINLPGNPYFFDIRNLVWAGMTLQIYDATGAVIPNSEFAYNDRHIKGYDNHNYNKGGEGPASIYVAEIVQLPNGDEVRGVRLELPGKKTVLISVTRQVCP